jgi:hypothetical protein
MTTVCRGGRTTGAVWPGRGRPRMCSREALSETMETLNGHPPDSVIDRFEDPSASGESGAGQMVRPAGLTSRDTEAAALVRLARMGYDWTDTLERRRETP